MLANRLRLGGRKNPLTIGSSNYTLNPYGIGAYAGGGITADQHIFGYPSVGGGLAPTALDAYTVAYSDEVVFYNSKNGTFTGAISRTVDLVVSGGPIPLIQTDITSIVCPGTQTLSTASATFTPQSDGGAWQWSVAAGPDGFPTHMGAGTLTVTV